MKNDQDILNQAPNQQQTPQQNPQSQPKTLPEEKRKSKGDIRHRPRLFRKLSKTSMNLSTHRHLAGKHIHTRQSLRMLCWLLLGCFGTQLHATESTTAAARPNPHAQTTYSQTENLVQLPFYEGFEKWENGIPVGWKTYDQNQDGTGWQESTENARNGHCAMYGYNRDNYAMDWLVSPTLHLDKDCFLKFHYRVRSDVNKENLSIYLSTSGNDIMALQEHLLLQIIEATNTEYQEVSIDLSDFTGQDVNIGILAHSAKDRYGIYIDDFSVVSCYAPVSAQIVGIGQHEAYVSYQNPENTSNSGTEAHIAYRILKTIPQSGQYITETNGKKDNPLTDTLWQELHSRQSPAWLRNLDISTPYEVQVRNLCQDEDTSRPVILQFQTACPLHGLPFTENFSHVHEGEIPDCWDNSEGSENNPEYRWNVPAETDPDEEIGRYLLFNNKLSAKGRNNYLKTPLIHTTGQESLRLSFSYINNEGQRENPSLLSVYSTLDAGLSYDTIARHLHSGTAWKDTTILLHLKHPVSTISKAEIEGGNHLQIVFEAVSNYGFGRVGIDNFSLTSFECPPPYNVRVSDITGSSARISWQSGAARHRISYFPQGQAEQSFHLFSDTCSALLSELRPGTEYEVRIEAIASNGDTSQAATAYFETPCTAVSLPYREGFENVALGDFLPPCWTETVLASDPDADFYWECSNMGIDAAEGTSYLYFYSFGLAKGAHSRVSTPLLEAHSSVEVSFKLYHWREFSGQEKLIVSHSDIRYPDKTFPIDTISCDFSHDTKGGWTGYAYRLPEFSQGRIHFEAIGQRGQNILIDQLEVKAIPSIDLQIGLSSHSYAFGDTDSLQFAFRLSNSGALDFNGKADIRLKIKANENKLAYDSLLHQIDFSANPLPTAESRNFIFEKPFTLKGYGQHQISLTLNASGDTQTGNDTASFHILHYPSIEIPANTRLSLSDFNPVHISVFDLNQDGITWERRPDGSYHCPPQSEWDSDDLLVLPAMHLEPGIYHVSALAEGERFDRPESMALYLFPDTWPSTVLHAFPLSASCLESGKRIGASLDFFGNGIEIKDSVNINTGGVYYFGIHACSFQDQGGLNLSGFSVRKISSRPIPPPEPIRQYIDTTLCHGETILFAGSELSRSGSYTDTLSTAWGADSIVFLNLQIEPNYLFNLDTLICQGATLYFGGRTYSQAGEYEEIYKSRHGCDSIYRLRLEVLPLPAPPVILQETVQGKTVLVSDQEAANQWYKDGSALKGETGNELVPTGNGLYHATVRNACGESDPSNKIEIKDLSNHSDPMAESFRVYPNPAQDYLHVESPSQRIERMDAFNLNGKRIYSGLPKARSCRLDVSAWTPGTYILQIHIQDKTMPFKIEIAR